MNREITMSKSAWGALLLLSLIWGGSFLAFALGLRELPVFTLVAHRVFWGAVLLWIIVIARKIPLPARASQWVFLAVMGFLNNAIPFTLIAWAQTNIESGLASILNGTTAIFTVLLASLFFTDEHLGLRKFAGVVLAFIGVTIAIGIDALASLDPRSLAQIAIIGSSISYAFAAVWGRKMLGGLHPVMAATGMVTCSSIMMLAVAFYHDGIPNIHLSSVTWAAVLFLGGPATGIAYLLYYRVLRLGGSGNLSLVTLLVPPIAVILGAAVLGEKLQLAAYFGFALIALGMLIIDGRVLRYFSKRD